VPSQARRKKRPFFMVSADLYKWGLSRNAQDVYVFLCKMADNETGTSKPGKKYIAANCKISLASVYRAVRELKERGLLTEEQRREKDIFTSKIRQTTNIYTVYDSPGEAFDGLCEDTPPVTVTPPPCHERQPPPVTGDRGTILF